MMCKTILKVLSLFIFMAISACKPSVSSELLALQTELKETKTALEEMEALKELESATETIKDALEPLNALSPSFDHMVFLNIKDDLSKEEKKTLMSELKVLDEIEEVEDFEIGRFKDVGDGRALSDYELVMKMSFDNKKAYESYQDHPKHLDLKKKLGTYLAGPPAVYDYRY